MEVKTRSYKDRLNKGDGSVKNRTVPFIFMAFCLLLSVFCVLPCAYANNIRVANCQILNMSEGSTTADIQFDISWDNSWRYGVFYDAAWVFAKVSVNDGAWIHATISGVTSIGASGTSLTIDVPTDSKGAFLYRSADATGTLSTTAVKLQWFRQGDGVAYNAAKVKIQVFAIEMVHIPQGSFYLGDGTARSGGSVSHFFDASSASGAPVKITSSTPYVSNVSDGTGTAGDIAWINENYGGNTYADYLPASRAQLNVNFPTGYNSFYMMKYELNQGQYRDFLNTLTRAQQTSRVYTNISSGTTSITNVFVMNNTATVQTDRVGIACATTIPATAPVNFFCDYNANRIGNESSDGEWIPMKTVNWMDFCAYADWAGLRPMTELEFEKACRGPKPPVAGEFAWGTTNLTNITGISNAGTINEVASNGTANASIGGGYGTLRGGFAATSSTTSRQSTGASYYGIMELSGNIYERVVTIMDSIDSGAAVSKFTGLNGDGILSASGYANVDYWPGNNGTNGVGGEVTGYQGAGQRGGNDGYGTDHAYVSSRVDGAYIDGNRNMRCGRMVRMQ
ncbi:MAG: SUMF1/EgtB/PvdO family nonheme iron enzyme [Candidatus Omnitrophica bacterium]|nr:SUMF1/EgtB/PvdO family nonheme iron enzyme [Candidatus Omnitrophota bacterium]